MPCCACCGVKTWRHSIQAIIRTPRDKVRLLTPARNAVVPVNLLQNFKWLICGAKVVSDTLNSSRVREQGNIQGKRAKLVNPRRLRVSVGRLGQPSRPSLASVSQLPLFSTEPLGGLSPRSPAFVAQPLPSCVFSEPPAEPWPPSLVCVSRRPGAGSEPRAATSGRCFCD